MTSFGDNPDYTPSSWGRRKDGQPYPKNGNGSGSSGISGNNNSVEGSVIKKLPDLNQPVSQPQGMSNFGTPSSKMKKYEDRTVEKGYIPIEKAWGLPINFPENFEDAVALAHHPDTDGMSVVKGADGKEQIKIGKFRYGKGTLAGYPPEFDKDGNKIKDGKKFSIWRILSQTATLNGIPQSTIDKTIFPKQSWKCAFVLWLLPKKLDF